MQYQYDIAPEDFVALNVYYAQNDPIYQKSFKKMRMGATMLVLFGGLIFMLSLNSFTPLAVVVYGIAAALVYKFLPKYIFRSLRKNVDRTIKNSANQSICGPKTFYLDENTCRLTGEKEDSTYEYGALSRVVEDTAHYYIFLDDISALILPFRAFADEGERQAFYTAITDKITAAKAEKTPENDG